MAGGMDPVSLISGGFNGGQGSYDLSTSATARQDSRSTATQGGGDWNIYTGGSQNKSNSVPVLWIALGAGALVLVLLLMRRKG